MLNLNITNSKKLENSITKNKIINFNIKIILLEINKNLFFKYKFIKKEFINFLALFTI